MNFHLKSALTSIKRSPFQALAAIITLTVTFFVGTIFAVVLYASARTLNYFETRPQIIVFLKNEATNETISALQKKLTEDSRTKEVHFVSKEEALTIYKEATSGNPLLGELVNPSIFPASLEFSLVNLADAKDIIAEIKTEAIVDSIGFTASLGDETTLNDVVFRLKKAIDYVKIGGGFFALLLVGTSFLVLVMILGMRIVNRKNETEILNLIGASAKFIKKPVLLESLIYVLTGVFCGWLLTLIIVLYITPAVINYFGQIPVIPRDPLSFFALFAVILGVELLFGLILAATGSNLALSRSRRSR